MRKCILFFFILPIFSVLGQVTKTIDLEGGINSYYFEVPSDNYSIEANYDYTKQYNISFVFSKGSIAPFLVDNTALVRVAGVVIPPVLICQKRLFRGDKLVITVTKPNDPTYKKEFTFEVPPSGTWKTSFGATAVLPCFNQESSYYVEQTSIANEYKIKKGDNPNKTYFIPTIFYHFMPYVKEDSKWSCGLTAGMGVQTNNGTASFFLGGSAVYYQNIAVQIGFAYHQMNILKTQYKEEQTIKQNLTPDDLTQKAYRFNPFVSLSFRFEKNPNK